MSETEPLVRTIGMSETDRTSHQDHRYVRQFKTDRASGQAHRYVSGSLCFGGFLHGAFVCAPPIVGVRFATIFRRRMHHICEKAVEGSVVVCLCN